jgi:hypothetical protein
MGGSKVPSVVDDVYGDKSLGGILRLFYALQYDRKGVLMNEHFLLESYGHHREIHRLGILHHQILHHGIRHRHHEASVFSPP